MRSWKKPTPEQVNKAVALLAAREQRRHFFDKLNNPLWVEPLREKGFFQNPPDAVPDESTGHARLAAWPELEYLVRMAREVPDLVTEVALEIPDTTNSRIHAGLADIALAVPANLSAKFVDSAMTWIASTYQYFAVPDKLGKLISHLARRGQPGEAIELARELLRLFPEPKERTRRIEEELKFIVPPPEVSCHFDYLTYEKIAVSCAPDLVQGGGIDGFSFLCDMLDTGVRFSSRNPDEVKPEDFSHIWRPSVEGKPPYHTHGFKDLFTTVVRDAAEQLIKEGSCSVAGAVELLEEREWHVFRRIALRTLRVFHDPENDRIVDLIEARLIDKNLFDSRSVRSDYNLLLVKHRGRLREQHIGALLDWIEQGPDVQGWEGSQEGIDRYVRRWQRDRLRPLKEVLPRVWKERYRNLQAEFGEEEVEEGVVWMGGVSPRSPAELKEMEPGAIIDLLASWEPEVDPLRPWVPSVEGLEQSLSDVVSESPSLFRDHYEQLQGVPARYIRAVLSGLVGAARNNSVFDWDPLVGLCEWIVDQPRRIGDHAAPIWQSDPGWGWTRSVLADLLQEGLKSVPRIPFGHRERMWRLIEVLSSDPDPAVEREVSLRDGNEIDALSYSKQSIRAQAVVTAFRYALWVRQHEHTAGLVEEAAAPASGIMREVKDVLDERLGDRSIAVAAVYGQWFPTLLELDADWAREVLDRVFPQGESQIRRSRAAFSAYLVSWRPGDELHELLRGRYEVAADQLGSLSRDEHILLDPEKGLAEHLMAFYWRGTIGVDDESGLLARFWSKASDEIAAHAVEFVGRSLRSSVKAVEADVLERFRKLWEHRSGRILRDAVAHTRELEAFGWWFDSGLFDDVWAVQQLECVIEAIGLGHLRHHVDERLAAVSGRHPGDALRCLALLVEKDDEGWLIGGMHNEARVILENALKSKRTDVVEQAKDLINRLALQGYHGFRDLWPT